ncbi:enoyl-CoA hydratase [Caulobacter sp. KR2-114]|uniref:enoyl-CoA hydratase n=1 Tax=Caulobacter sp. KR2-114 TaxID=3400912 RepID=UPI003C03828D
MTDQTSGPTAGDGQVQVRLDQREGGVVAFVVLDNARRLNVMNSALMEGFVATLAELADNEALRAVVLTGAGDRAFVGGADVDEMAAIASPDAARSFILKVHACCRAVRDLPVPVIARVNGYCLGAGLELAAACDLRVASLGSTFGMPEVKLGIPSVVEAALLPGLVGWGRARQMLLLGETFGAAEARAWRLIEEACPAAEIDLTVERWLAALMTSTPKAVRLQKALIRRWEDLPLTEAIAAGVEAFADAYRSDEPAQAMQAFQDARAARRGGG